MDIKTLTSAEEWGTRTTGQIGPTMHYEEEEKMIQRYKLCLYRDGTPMVESDDGNYVLYADHLSILEAEKKTWRCFNCGFETSDKTEAEAHFGEGEGGVGLCVEWSNMDSSERVRAYQELTMELNETREENIALEAAVKEKEKQIELYLRTTRGHLSTIFVLNERIAALTAMLEFKEKWVCPNCKKEGPHYVPPSLGEEGFFVCDPSKVIQDKDKETDHESK